MFVCLCEKKYKSYAAVYTHIRNKHNFDQKYLNRISRPNWTNQQKGRPKRTKQYPIKIQDMRA